MQAYALRQWLMEKGADVEFINYHPHYVEDGGKFHRPFDPALWRVNFTILYLRLSTMKRRYFGSRSQAHQLDVFRQEELGISGPRFETEAQLESYLNSPQGKFDILICGSDQIWNPSPQRGLDPAYFLAFRSDIGGARRISYAPSFGRDSLDSRYDAEVGELIKHLEGISVREASGVAIVKRLTGRSACCVPDPTILHGDLSKLLENAEEVPTGHVFCYALRTGEGIRQVAELVSSRLHQEILSPYNVHRRWREIGRTVHPSPMGWVSLINKAGFVVTNSFHGAACSILLRKPFLVVGLPGSKAALDARVKHLLGELNLSHRFVAAGDTGATSVRFVESIDWEAVEPLLQRVKDIGRSYLETELAKA
jgi:hypothetical protein